MSLKDVERKQSINSKPVCAVKDVQLSVAILLWPGFPLMSLSGLVESMRHAGDHGDGSQPRYAQWQILGASSSKMLSSCGIPVESTAGYAHPGEFDYVFVIGGLLKDIDTAPRQHRRYLHWARRTGVPLVGVCTGSFVLAQEKLLDGKSACVHAYHQNDFQRAFPNHQPILDKEFDLSERGGTVLGGICILPLMSEIIRQHIGSDRSAKMVCQMSFPGRGCGDAPKHPDMSAHLQINDPRIQKALVFLDAEACGNPSIARLARSLGLSERHFLRLFRDQLGTSPKNYLLNMKLKLAAWRLRNTTQSITSIAYSTGFSSGANLADHCRKRLNTTPSQIRREIWTKS